MLHLGSLSQPYSYYLKNPYNGGHQHPSHPLQTFRSNTNGANDLNRAPSQAFWSNQNLLIRPPGNPACLSPRLVLGDLPGLASGVSSSSLPVPGPYPNSYLLCLLGCKVEPLPGQLGAAEGNPGCPGVFCAARGHTRLITFLAWDNSCPNYTKKSLSPLSQKWYPNRECPHQEVTYVDD